MYILYLVVCIFENYFIKYRTSIWLITLNIFVKYVLPKNFYLYALYAAKFKSQFYRVTVNLF